VLDGAAALAVPTKQGQSLHIESERKSIIRWKSWDNKGACWFEAVFELVDFSIFNASDISIANTLADFFKVIETENGFFSKQQNGFRCETRLEFPRDWGLGSSSTLIYMLAQWTGINPYFLLEKTMGGSGYDLACAGIDSAIIYERNGVNPTIQIVDFQPIFAENLYFIHLGKKQNSREGITRYRAKKGENQSILNEITNLSKAMLDCKTLAEMEQVIANHEKIVADYLDLPMVQSLYFADYWGKTKSLGAWGGDFILATSERSEPETLQYFQQKGYQTIIPYHKMILS
jgi:mevalonate kinase